MIAWLVKILGSIFGLKAIMGWLVITVIALVLYNLIVDLVQEVLNFALNQINGVSDGGYSNPSLTGFAGWFFAQVKLPECIGVIASFVSIKFILTKIPFLRW